MIISKYYNYKLRFHIDNEEKIIKWNKLKEKCENMSNSTIIEHIKSFCDLQQNRELLYYKDDGKEIIKDKNNEKQFIFRATNNSNDNNIVIEDIFGEWTYEELNDLITGVIKTIEFYLQVIGCIYGSIEKIDIC
jgi:hypothetical protein